VGYSGEPIEGREVSTGRSFAANRWRAIPLWRLLALALASIGLAAAAGGASTRAAADTPAAGVQLVPVDVFNEPVYVASVPRLKHLLFVVERHGTVRVLRNGVTVEQPFLDISDRVDSSYFEDGLLSIAFRPHSSLMYAFYTNEAGNNEVDEFRFDKRVPTQVIPGSRRQVLEVPRPAQHAHNGGQLQFGPDKLLYISTGDGSFPSDPYENAQDTHSLLGKLLRIEPRGRGHQPYRIPKSNPYVGRDGRDEIYALGFRNPWRFSFDRETGAIAVGDVGEAAWEEVDYEPRGQARGANFGWDDFEGDQPFESQVPPPNFAPPIFEYPHSGVCSSITGGYVVRDPHLANLDGRYLYGDFCTGELRSLIPGPNGATDDQALVQSYAPSSFGEGPSGQIYVTSLAGAVYRLESSP
jgi:glucose/arabinose dehydrogenase